MAVKYDDNSIKILEGIEAVRQRQGMYIGSTDKRGLHHLVWEIVDNSIDEAINGYASGIDSVKYSFKNGENNTTEGNFARGASCDENGNTNQNGAYTLYKTTFDLPEGESNLVTVTVADRVGNTSSAELNLK